MNPETFVGHDRSLCGRCEELGYSCVGDVGRDTERVVVDDEGEEVVVNQIEFPLLVNVVNKDQKKKKKGAKKVDPRVVGEVPELGEGETPKQGMNMVGHLHVSSLSIQSYTK
ncbi:hypothetical protein HK104_008380 [Borealophlyctis nickersoniae]|nr:hypothetical protein HK104_008380 [Borealophlyctis nickersoniae]